MLTLTVYGFGNPQTITAPSPEAAISQVLTIGDSFREYAVQIYQHRIGQQYWFADVVYSEATGNAPRIYYATSC